VFTARYRLGLSCFLPRLLEQGLGRSKLGRRLFTSGRLRKWLYYGVRRGTGSDLRWLARANQKAEVIWDAARAGKAREAIEEAFRAALLGGDGQDAPGDQPRLETRRV
jgi:hypothetical protein